MLGNLLRRTIRTNINLNRNFMTNSIKDLPIFNCDPHYYAPDGSQIRLGPQYNMLQGNVASATFAANSVSQAVMHSKEAPIAIAEKWFYPKEEGLPNFYLSMDDEIYEITPGTKIEMPVGTQFQVFNPSKTPLPILMITYPWWPQDERAQLLVDKVEGPWKKTDLENPVPRHHTYLTPAQILELSTTAKDRFFSEGMSGDDYVKKCLGSIGQNPDDYKIAGKTWTNYADKLVGLTQEAAEKICLDIPATPIPSEMQSKIIPPLSAQEKEEVIRLSRVKTESASTESPASSKLSQNSQTAGVGFAI